MSATSWTRSIHRPFVRAPFTRGLLARGLGAAATAVAGGFAVLAFAAPPVGDSLSFVACPIARDTGPDTDLCFFAEYDGERYALVNPPDWGNMQLKHRVLVEARVAGGDLVCGAIPLDARISILPELDPSCDTILPFDGVSPPARPQPAAMLELARRVDADPSLSLQPVRPEMPYRAPTPPFAPEELTIFYPFASDRATDADMLELLRLKDIALAVPARVELDSQRGVSLLSDGTTIEEHPDMADRRAAKIAGILVGLGIDRDRIDIRSIDPARGGTGRDDWRSRRVVLRVTPLTGD
jgi:hypothetical protein